MTISSKHERFLERAREIHGDRYDYSQAEYTGIRDKVKIICKEHGEFLITPNNHISLKQGCKKCGLLSRSKNTSTPLKELLSTLQKIHPDYIFLVPEEYNNLQSELRVICPVHGEFVSNGKKLKKHGCAKCGKSNVNNRLSLSKWAEKAKEVHGDTYDYGEIIYYGHKSYLSIECEKHGPFQQSTSNHVHRESKCPKCASFSSKAEIEISNFIKSLGFDTVKDKKQLQGSELDIFIPEKQIAIEYNGLYYHSDVFRDKNYHLDKTEKCLERGISLIHIFEDEWLYKKEIVKSRLKNIFNKTESRIFARKTTIKEVSTSEAMLFLDKNHIQGRVGGAVKLGLYFEDTLVSIMTFGALRKNMGRVSTEGVYELLRFCNKTDTTVVGGASKLLKHFEKEYKPNKIISYADRCWSVGNLYNKLGFTLIRKTVPNYFYIKHLKRYNRYLFTKHKLVEDGFDKDKTEKEIMNLRGFHRVYNSGNLLFEKTLDDLH